MKRAWTWLFPFWPAATLKPDLTIRLLTSVFCHYVCSRFWPKGGKCSPYQARQPRLGCEVSAILLLSLKCFSKWIYSYLKKETLCPVVKLNTVRSFHACTENSALWFRAKLEGGSKDESTLHWPHRRESRRRSSLQETWAQGFCSRVFSCLHEAEAWQMS